VSRADGRSADELRPVGIELGFVQNPAGSALIRMGRTMVLCTVHVEEQVPPFLRGSGRGWVTAEYSLLPGSTETRSAREAERGAIKGRTHEIQRLIGRSLRSVVDLTALGERALLIDCDVLQADGGTRTAAITGAYVALAAACQRLRRAGYLQREPLRDTVAAVSVGRVGGEILLDLPYQEDARAEVDMNVVMTGSGRLVEVQGTGEEATFDRAELGRMLDLAEKGIRELTQAQQKVLAR
jgi:ribonuclease PH